jgi:DNA-binding MarR family transcriptional regulator
MTIEKDLENAILSFHHKLTDEMYKQAKKFKLTPSQLEVLHYVAEEGNPTMKEIASKLHITPPSVTTIVEPLCQKNFIKREINGKDRRIIRITITHKTFKLFSLLIKNKKLVMLRNLFLKLNDKEKKELIKIINIIIKE